MRPRARAHPPPPPSSPALRAVDALKEQIEGIITAPLDEMRRLISRHIMMMPKKIADMRMSDFLREGGGSLSAVLDKQKKDAK